jgi:hypothetical protein
MWRPLQIDSHKEVEAWKVAMCLMHPLDPQCGKTPSSLITTCAIKPLVMLADKYNLQVRWVSTHSSQCYRCAWYKQLSESSP